MIVKFVLKKLEIPYEDVEMGRVKVQSPLSAEKRNQLNAALKYYELELMENSRQILVERIKVLISEMFRSEENIQLKFSEYLGKKLDYDYTYLANTFSQMEGITIERFFILKKVERVKEMILYDGLTIKEIAAQLHYTSVSHLCQQFKKVTGLTPTKFKVMWENSAGPFEPAGN